MPRMVKNTLAALSAAGLVGALSDPDVPFTVMLLGMIAAAVAVAGGLALQTKFNERIFREVDEYARSMGLEVTREHLWKNKFEGALPEGRLSIVDVGGSFRSSKGNSEVRVKLSCENVTAGVHISSRSLVDGSAFETGQADFDKMFTAKGPDEHLAVLLSPEVRKALMYLQSTGKDRVWNMKLSNEGLEWSLDGPITKVHELRLILKRAQNLMALLDEQRLREPAAALLHGLSEDPQPQMRAACCRLILERYPDHASEARSIAARDAHGSVRRAAGIGESGGLALAEVSGAEGGLSSVAEHGALALGEREHS